MSDKKIEKLEELVHHYRRYFTPKKASICSGYAPMKAQSKANKLYKELQAIDSEQPIDSFQLANKIGTEIDSDQSQMATVTLSKQQYENKLIDFGNWYLRLIKVSTDKDERFDIENRDIIWSFLRGDDYKHWWKDEPVESSAEEIHAQQTLFREILDKHLLENKVYLTSNELHTIFDACWEYAQSQRVEIKDINFIKWYSGMEESKIRKAFERYKNEQ